MRRFPDWPERLAKFLESRRVSPKQWGVNDCGMFCADAIAVMTGTHMAEELRGYHSGAGALRSLLRYQQCRVEPVSVWQRQTDDLLLQVVLHQAELYELEEIGVTLAQRGDLVLLDATELPREPEVDMPIWRSALGIIGMDGLPVTAGLEGIVTIGAWRIARAWRI